MSDVPPYMDHPDYGERLEKTGMSEVIRVSISDYPSLLFDVDSDSRIYILVYPGGSKVPWQSPALTGDFTVEVERVTP